MNISELTSVNALNNKVVIECSACKDSVMKIDPFTHKPHYYCNRGYYTTGPFGDMTLMNDNGCDEGTPK